MVARQTPNGDRMDNGFSTKIAFEQDPDIALWEKTVKPPGVDGGDSIPTSTMHNVEWRTFGLQVLKTLTDSSFTAAWDPAVYDQIVAMTNVEQMETLHFPDSSELDFYGGLRQFEPGDQEDGTQPTATVIITPTNTHPTTGLETAPNYRGPSS